MNPESNILSESLFFGIIATLLTIITIIQTYRANKFAKKSAIAQGIFQKPNLQIEIYGDSDTEDFIIALPLEYQKVIEMPLTYTLHNSGEISAKEIEIYVRMNKNLRYGGHGEYVGIGSKAKKWKVAVANETENMITMVTTINNLHPNQRLVISDMISINSSTIYNNSGSAKTADNVDVTFKYRVVFAYAIDIIISQSNQSPITKRISLSIINTSERTVKDYFDEYNQVQLQGYRERIAKLHLFARLKQVWFRRGEIKKVKLLIIDQSSYKENQINPAHVFNVHSMEMCEGFKDAQGYCIPAVNVSWPHN